MQKHTVILDNAPTDVAFPPEMYMQLALPRVQLVKELLKEIGEIVNAKDA